MALAAPFVFFSGFAGPARFPVGSELAVCRAAADESLLPDGLGGLDEPADAAATNASALLLLEFEFERFALSKTLEMSDFSGAKKTPPDLLGETSVWAFAVF